MSFGSFPPPRMGMLFRGFGGQPPRASDAFGFGQHQPIGTPPYNPGAPVGPDTPAPAMGSFDPTPAQGPTVGAPGGYVDPAADPQTGFFQKNGMGLNLIGAIADGVSQGFGGAPNFAMARQQHQALQRDQQQFQRAQAVREQERIAEHRQWVERQIWEREHPAPIRNDTVNDYEFLRQKLGQEQADQYLRNFAAGPVMAVEGFDAAGNPTKTFVPRGSLGTGAPADNAGPDFDPPPTKPVGNLHPYRGGAPSQGGGTFR